jgi:hypothetical protein
MDKEMKKQADSSLSIESIDDVCFMRAFYDCGNVTEHGDNLRSAQLYYVMGFVPSIASYTTPKS